MYPYSYPHYHYPRPYVFHGLAHVQGCCKPLVKRVVCVDPCANPVLFTIDGLFSELAQNNCFRLVICADTLQMASVHPVALTDGCDTFPLIEGCTGNVVHYDQLVTLVNHRKCGCGKAIELDCYYGNDGPPENALHVVCNSILPRTTFIPAPHPVI